MSISKRKRSRIPQRGHELPGLKQPRLGAAVASDMAVGGPNAVEAVLARVLGSGSRGEGGGQGGFALCRVLLEEGAGKRARVLAERARLASVPVSGTGRGECDRIAGVRSQGIAAEITYGYADFEWVLKAETGLLLFLDGISDPHNLGAVIRSAEAAGVLAVVIQGRRAAQVNATVMRVSAGAAAFLPVCRVSNISRAVTMARNAGFWVVGLDHESPRILPRGGGVARKSVAEHAGGNVVAAGPAPVTGSPVTGSPVSGISEGSSRRLGLAVGSEGMGLGRLVAAACDELARLPMRGRVESLNASVAASLAIYRMLDSEIFGTQS